MMKFLESTIISLCTENKSIVLTEKVHRMAELNFLPPSNFMLYSVIANKRKMRGKKAT